MKDRSKSKSIALRLSIWTRLNAVVEAEYRGNRTLYFEELVNADMERRGITGEAVSSAGDAHEKLTAKKLLNLPPTLMGRLKRMAALLNQDESKIIRQAVVKELDRMEAVAAVEAGRREKLKALAAAHGGDVDAALDYLLKRSTEPLSETVNL